MLHGNIQLSFGSGRIGIWTYSAKLLKQTEYLLTGTGVDTFVIRLNSFLKTWFAEHPDAERLKYYYDNPHNDYLALLLNCGIPAVLLFLVLVLGGCFGREIWRDAVLCYGIQLLLSWKMFSSGLLVKRYQMANAWVISVAKPVPMAAPFTPIPSI